MLDFCREKIGRIAEWLGRTVSSYRFALAAFLLPLFIRSIPEILVGPYPIGWDTIAFYVPNTLDWAAGKAGFTEILGTAPLMYLISVPVYLLSRVNPVWIFKIMGPILYGSMIWALFRFLVVGLKWPDKQALVGALLTALFFSIAYSGLVVPGISLARVQTSFPTLLSLGSSLGFLGYAYLALTPLILIGLGEISNVDVKIWTVFCVAIAGLALLPFFGPN